MSNLNNHTNRMCFLILAHNDIKMLKKLIQSLDFEMFDIYVHIDKKSPINNYQFSDLNLKYSNCYFLNERINVYWGDISIVEATLQLYKFALGKYNYARFITLSGNDYPIKSNKDIYKILSNFNVEFIMGNELDSDELYKVKKYHFFKHNRINRKILSMIATIFKKKKKDYIIFNGKLNKIYFAPQWHALTLNCVKYILRTIDQNVIIMHYFKYSYAPDELLIPTIVFNSEFRSKTLGFNLKDVHYNLKNATHYLDYNPTIKVFNENDYEKIIFSNKLFFRKVKSGISEKLIEKIDKYRY